MAVSVFRMRPLKVAGTHPAVMQPDVGQPVETVQFLRLHVDMLLYILCQSVIHRLQELLFERCMSRMCSMASAYPLRPQPWLSRRRHSVL